MKMQAFPKALLALSSVLLITACGQTNAVTLQIPDLGVSVTAGEGGSVQKVVEGGYDVYRVYVGENPIVDIEKYEDYDFTIDSLMTSDGIRGVLASWGDDFDVIDEKEGQYGAATSYETPDHYGVLAGFKNGDKEAICQASTSSDPNVTIDQRFEVCASMTALSE